MIVKADRAEKGRYPRFVVTNLGGEPQPLYDEGSCACGEIENRIKEQQLGLLAGRTSYHDWWINQWGLLLSGPAYTLLERLRRNQAGWHRVGASAMRHDSAEAAEDMGGAGVQHAAGAVSVGGEPPAPRVVCERGGDAVPRQNW